MNKDRLALFLIIRNNIIGKVDMKDVDFMGYMTMLEVFKGINFEAASESYEKGKREYEKYKRRKLN